MPLKVTMPLPLYVFCLLLTVIFAVLQYTGVITWPWYFVLSPVLFITGIFWFFVIMVLFLVFCKKMFG